MEKLNFKKANKSDISIIFELAVKIWRKHYPSIISNEQIEYMLEKMYSKESLAQQMDDGHVFWLAFDHANPIGYLSYNSVGNGDYFLNKFYIDVDRHRKGIGKQLFDHVFSHLSDARTIRLTVNRKNHIAINYYFKNGFIIEEVKDFDIGDGFEMNDFVMLKLLIQPLN